VKLYDLLVDGYHTPRSAEDIAELYRAGRLRKSDPCRVSGAKGWRTLDELFPLLKYDSQRLCSSNLVTANSSVLDHTDSNGVARPAVTSALKAGWICFGLGLTVSWFFPLGNVFFSVAAITAVVAMCTHQVNRGLALLISSFCGIVLCAVMFFGLALGAVALTGAAAMQRVDADLKQSRATQRQALAQMNASVQHLQAPLPSIPLPPAVVSDLGIPRSTVRPTVVPRPVDTQRQQAIRQAEMQRDRTNAKEQRIEQLQKSIDWQDEQIRRIRNYGGNESFFVKQRDELLRQKWELQR
jgi:hypothetical protein